MLLVTCSIRRLARSNHGNIRHLGIVNSPSRVVLLLKVHHLLSYSVFYCRRERTEKLVCLSRVAQTMSTSRQVVR